MRLTLAPPDIYPEEWMERKLEPMFGGTKD